MEFDIIPVSEQQVNKSPVIVVDDKLGLESWCIKRVYKYCHQEFISWKVSRRDCDHKAIHDSSNQELVSWKVSRRNCDHKAIHDSSNIRDLIRLSNVILLLNPEFKTVWNFRRSLIASNRLLIDDDLKFSELVLSRKPRNPEVFSYRQFLLQRLPNISLRNVQHELDLTLESSSKYFRNYYSWSHRTWLMINLRPGVESKRSLGLNSGISLESFDRLLFDDIETARNFIRNHVSDFSGYQYIQTLIQYLHSCTRNNGVNLLEVLHIQFHFLDELLSLYPDRESIFLHRRFLLQMVKMNHPHSHRDFLEKEKIFIESCRKESEFLIERHKKWCDKFWIT